MERRKFLKTLAGSLALLGGTKTACRGENTGAPPKGSPAFHKGKGKSKVAVVRSSEITRDRSEIISNPGALLSEGLTGITGKKTSAEAWRSLFGENDRVGIKINALAGPKLSPSPPMVRAIVEGLLIAGVKENNIIVWDRSTSELKRAGFVPNVKAGGVLFAGTGAAYEAQTHESGAVGSCFSKILTEFCTAVINVGVLKDHDLAGVSICMKNWYGVIHNPNKYHDNNCDPYVADLARSPLIRKKLRLSICDAFRAQYDGGPAYKPHRSWLYGGYLLSLDEVALDRIGAGIIEKKRKEQGLNSLGDGGREPKWIATAEERSLGNGDPSKIELLEIEV
jgi:uncharacterized protein (DUF362 family)